MRYFLILGAVCLAVLVNARRTDRFTEVRKQCKLENHLPEDGPLPYDTSKFFEDPKSKCYSYCYLTATKIIKDNGEVDVEHALELIDEDLREQSRPQAEKCAKEGKELTDKCEWAYTIMKCFYEGVPEVFPLLGVLEPPRESPVE